MSISSKTSSNVADIASNYLRMMAQNHLTNYIAAIEPDFTTPPHIQLMIAAIERAITRPNGRLLINLPPRHGKSTLCSIMLPTWYLGNHPDQRVIHISHSTDLSADFSKQARAIVRDHPRYHRIFPATKLSRESTAVRDWRTTAGGGFRSVGITTGITGYGADLMIIDDPHDETDAHSLTILDQKWDWYTTAARTRLSPGAPIIMLATRWHTLDLPGRLLNQLQGDDWQHIRLPAIAEEGDLLGRDLGAALWPERYNTLELARIRANNPAKFTALYQNNPTADSEIIFHPAHMKPIRNDPLRTAFGETFWTFDLAISQRESADWTVMANWYWNPIHKTLTLLNSIRLQRNYPYIRDVIIDISQKHPDQTLIFPTDNYETILVTDIRPRIRARVTQIKLQGDKRTKAAPLSTLVAQKRFRYLEHRGDNTTFVREMAQFPHARHDDCVDAAALAGHYATNKATLTAAFI